MAMNTLHAAIGIGIATIIKNPAISLPIALLSHMWMDFYPEWNFSVSKIKKEDEYNLKAFKWDVKLLFIIQLFLVVFIMGFLISQNNWVLWSAAFLANLMDLVEFISLKKWGKNFLFFHGGNFPFKINFHWQYCSMLPVQNAFLDLTFVVIILISCWK